MREVELVQHPQIPGLNLFLDTMDYRTPHLHKELELVWVLDGEMAVHSVQKDCRTASGDLVLFNPKETHEFRKLGDSCTFLCLQLSPRFFAYGFPAMEGLHFDEVLPSRSLSGEDYRDIRRMLGELAAAYFRRESGYALLCAGWLGLILHRLVHGLPHHTLTEAEGLEQERRGQRLDRLIDFVEENHRQKIRLTDFARQEGRSMSYISHFVKESLGQSFRDYVSTVRFQTACTLIGAGRDKLLDVCTASGFSDYRYFSRTFRERLGMTPEAYRAQLGQAGPAAAKPQNPHSLERFYSAEESLRLLAQLRGEP
ncbi:MAG: AraC family transcriptional regulator [Oscillospiraceae bacterium]|nr:AraC family transcriptional regulator [Oscillospiraceae bacterium]